MGVGSARADANVVVKANATVGEQLTLELSKKPKLTYF